MEHNVTLQHGLNIVNDSVQRLAKECHQLNRKKKLNQAIKERDEFHNDMLKSVERQRQLEQEVTELKAEQIK